MSDRKCPYCGSTEFLPMPLFKISGLDVGSISYVDTFACLKCGHMDIVAKREIIDKFLSKNKAEEEFKNELAAIEARRVAIDAEIKDLEALTRDENQTVKAVKEAQEKIRGLQIEKKNLDSKSSAVRYNHEQAMRNYRI